MATMVLPLDLSEFFPGFVPQFPRLARKTVPAWLSAVVVLFRDSFSHLRLAALPPYTRLCIYYTLSWQSKLVPFASKL